MDRRNSLEKMLLLGMLYPLTGQVVAKPVKAEVKRPEENRRIYLFSKVLQWIDFKEIPSVTRNLGYDGIDLTLREGGHIDPSGVRTHLPEFVKICKEEGLETPILTTRILDAEGKVTREILETAGKSGIRHYRMGWYDYDFSGNLESQLQDYRSQVEKLSTLNREYQISGNYQNHQGNGVGASLWDAHRLIENCEAGSAGIEYDIRHAMVEGAFSWTVDFELVKDRIRVLDIKDFVWECSKKNLRAINVPLGEGLVDYPAFFDLLNKNNIHTPLSIHVEHELGGAEKGDRKPRIPEDKILAAIKKDLQFLKRLI